MILFEVNQQALKTMGSKKLETSPIESLFKKRFHKIPEASGARETELLSDAFSHPMVEAAHISFAKHYPLTISPDMVWNCLAQGFAQHVNLHAEELRSKFVSYEGKQTIKIRRDQFIKGSPKNNWEGCFSEFSDQLEKIIGKKRDFVVSNFSTTSLIEKAVSEIILMDVMKSYVDFRVETKCGIPAVCLMGTVEDWKSIKARAQVFGEFGLEWWLPKLLPTLDQFIETAKGNVDVSHWDSYYKEKSVSGGKLASGWINHLFPYVKHYSGQMIKNKCAEDKKVDPYFDGTDIGDFPSGVSKVPFIWEYLGTNIDMEFMGGFVGVHQANDLGLEPMIGWNVSEK